MRTEILLVNHTGLTYTHTERNEPITVPFPRDEYKRLIQSLIDICKLFISTKEIHLKDSNILACYFGIWNSLFQVFPWHM